MGGEKGIPIAVAERRAKVDDFNKTVVYDTIENIVNLYKTVIGEHGGSQEGSTSISDILKIDGNAVDGSPQQSGAFPFTIAGFIPTPISQQIAVTNLSHLAYLPVKSIEAVYHGYKNGYNGKIGEADKFIENLFKERPLTAEELKKYFEDEEKKEAGGKKGVPEGTPEYDQKLGGISDYLSVLQKRQELMQIVMGKHIAKRKTRGLSLEELKYFDESLGGGLDALTYGMRHNKKPVEEIGINYFIAKEIKGG